MRCFHTRDSYLESTIGVGVNVERHRDGSVKTINALFDYISQRAFRDQNVRTGMCELNILVYSLLSCRQLFPYLPSGGLFEATLHANYTNFDQTVAICLENSFGEKYFCGRHFLAQKLKLHAKNALFYSEPTIYNQNARTQKMPCK